MTPEEYVREAMSTNLNEYASMRDRLVEYDTLKVLHAIMGIATESGELMDAMKKFLIYGKPLDDVNLMEEAGDLFWYVALLAHAVGFTFEDSFEKNIAKLKARYPNRFTEHDALNRDLNKEREILER